MGKSFHNRAEMVPEKILMPELANSSAVLAAIELEERKARKGTARQNSDKIPTWSGV